MLRWMGVKRRRRRRVQQDQTNVDARIKRILISNKRNPMHLPSLPKKPHDYSFRNLANAAIIPSLKPLFPDATFPDVNDKSSASAAASSRVSSSSGPGSHGGAFSAGRFSGPFSADGAVRVVRWSGRRSAVLSLFSLSLFASSCLPPKGVWPASSVMKPSSRVDIMELSFRGRFMELSALLESPSNPLLAAFRTRNGSLMVPHHRSTFFSPHPVIPLISSGNAFTAALTLPKAETKPTASVLLMLRGTVMNSINFSEYDVA